MILRIPRRIINAMRRELHWRENMPPEMYANLKEFREKYPSEPKYDPKSAALMEEIFGKRMYALLSSEVRELKLEVKHGKANFELGGEGWRPVLIADTEEELAAEIQRRELGPCALRRKVTTVVATLEELAADRAREQRSDALRHTVTEPIVTLEELAAEIRRRERRPDALRHTVTEATAAYTD